MRKIVSALAVMASVIWALHRQDWPLLLAIFGLVGGLADLENTK